MGGPAGPGRGAVGDHSRGRAHPPRTRRSRAAHGTARTHTRRPFDPHDRARRALVNPSNEPQLAPPPPPPPPLRNQQDVVPFLPPQVWLGYHHLNPESRWRIWDGACQQARCGLQDMLGGKTCVARDCPNMAAAVCGFNLERDHPQVRGRAMQQSTRACGHDNCACGCARPAARSALHPGGAHACTAPFGPWTSKAALFAAPQNAYVSKLKACMPEGAVPEACISAV